MMKIKNPQSQEFLDIYSAIVKFIKEKNGHVSENVRVIIRYKKGSKRRKEDRKIPKEINTFNLNWKKYMGGGIATYHREGDDPDHYYTSGGVTISTNLGQRLEDLVSEVCFEKTR